MAVELRHLRCFLAIVDEGNITRAAQRLHMSQPALSRTLAQLERTMAVRLVDRSTHHLIVTEAGSTFAIAAREAVERVDEAVASITAAVPPLRFGHSWSSATHAAAIVRSWTARFPERRLRFRRSDLRIAGLASGHVDIALVRGPITLAAGDRHLDGSRRDARIDGHSASSSRRALHPDSRRAERAARAGMAAASTTSSHSGLRCRGPRGDEAGGVRAESP